ncbi:ABC transporter permease [Luteithermobacter gelatinilyticus]|uniref:ABC transporter permease n=1 Tax=Luteithermobacter gelatinilyticus TaxID=2582913 RepID=UPI001105B5B4|nr:ABC transporter permease [Luteithermobacter gelatinilyticus]
MKVFRVWAVSRKEFIHILRDSRSLGMAIAIPMLLLLLFGYALSLDVDNVPTVVWDQNNSQSSREFISRLQGSRYFSVTGYVTSYPEIEEALDSAAALIALVIPEDFTGRIESGRSAPVQAIIDGSDPNTATIATGYLDVVAFGYSREVALHKIRRTTGRTVYPLIDLRPRAWFNADLESRNYIIPGLIAVIMMVIAALLTSLTVAREWEQGTMEQLIATPVKGSELILGKLIPYFAIGMLDVTLAVLMGEFLFGVPLRGSVALLFAMAAIFLAGALSLGMLISIVTKRQLLASQLAMVLTFLPSFLLSGFMYAIANMPLGVQLLTHLVPARYFVTMLKGIYLKDVGLEILALEAALLVLFGVILVLIANKRFRKRLG